jgi:hypothetical protein
MKFRVPHYERERPQGRCTNELNNFRIFRKDRLQNIQLVIICDICLIFLPTLKGILAGGVQHVSLRLLLRVGSNYGSIPTTFCELRT